MIPMPRHTAAIAAMPLNTPKLETFMAPSSGLGLTLRVGLTD